MSTIYDEIFRLHDAGAILTGSRVFGIERADSDWDFFISQDQELLMDLSCYERLSESDYKDSSVLKVLSHKNYRYKIHIQVCKNAQHKLRAQKLLLNMPRFILANADKTETRLLWDWALKTTF